MTEHPKHPMICTATSGFLSQPAPTGHLYLDFEENELSWRLCVNEDPVGNGLDGDLVMALETLEAIEYALNQRRHDHRASNRYFNDDEMMTHANWMEYTSLLHQNAAQSMGRLAKSLAASAATSRIRDRRKTA